MVSDVTSYKNSETPVPIMQGSPPPPDMLVTHQNWDAPPYNRWSFQHVREILPTVPVSRGDGPVREFPRAEQDLGDIRFELTDGREVSVSDLLDETYTDGFLVIHRGSIVYERYFNNMTPDTLHLSQSMAKSVCATVAGILIGRGLLDPNAPVSTYVPEFAECGYRDATLQQVMDMRSGVKFTEDYSDPHADMAKLDVASGWRPRKNDTDPRHVFDVILELEKERDHGGAFAYRSIETDVMSFCMERVTGKRLADLVSEELWSKLGMEHDADFTVDCAGYALACGGLNATLRDYGRFGQVHLDRGTVGGEEVVPAAWIEDIGNCDPAAFAASPYAEYYPNGAYRNQFWIADASKPAYMARGVFGQLIHVDPEHEMVTVKLSTWPDFLDPVLALNTAAAVAAIARELN